MFLGAISTVSVCFIFIIYRQFFIGFFTSDPIVAEFAYTRIYIILSFEVLNMTIEILSGCLRGIGFSTTPAIICVAGICGVRIFYIYTIYPAIASYANLMWIYPISWVFTSLALVVAYLILQKKAYPKVTIA